MGGDTEAYELKLSGYILETAVALSWMELARPMCCGMTASRLRHRKDTENMNPCPASAGLFYFRTSKYRGFQFGFRAFKVASSMKVLCRSMPSSLQPAFRCGTTRLYLLEQHITYGGEQWTNNIPHCKQLCAVRLLTSLASLPCCFYEIGRRACARD